MRCGVFASLGLSLTVLLLGQQTTSSSKEYVYSQDGFAITLPAPPSIWNDPALRTSTNYTQHPTSDIIMNVIVIREIKDCPADLASWEKAMREQVGAEFVKRILVNGHSAVEYESKGYQGDRIFGRFFCENGTHYALGGSWPVGDPRPAILTQIVDSFRLLSDAAHK